jgi:ubiquinone/menaquinone biosynthesis C-methylase UbiE
MKKEKQWEGYYTPYLFKAQKKGVTTLEVLDKEWFDGRTTAELCVLPHISKHSTVLEIACGIGRVSRFVAPRCKHLYCTDILEEALTEVKKNLQGFENVSFKKTNGYDLREFDADYFDCVYSFTAFFHFDFELVVNYFNEIKRVLKSGGTGIIEFKRWTDKQDVVQLLNKIEEQGGVRKYETELDKWRYVSKEMLKVLCDYYDLRVIDDDVTKFTFRK